MMLVSDWWDDTPRRATVGVVAAIAVLAGIVALYAALEESDPSKPGPEAVAAITDGTDGSSPTASSVASSTLSTDFPLETFTTDPSFVETDPTEVSPWDDTTNMTSPVTNAPTPSTTAPDRRLPVTAYSEEYEKYCRWAFSLSPDGILYDPEFTDDFYVLDDCIYDLDPTWGDFYASAAEAAQAGIDDAISTLEGFPLGDRLCWVDPATEQIGGCWVTPYSFE